MASILKETPKINVIVKKNKPKIIFTNNYILTYDKYSIYLYDINGNILDENKDIPAKNKEIYKINDNNFVSFYRLFLFKIEIINNKIEKTTLKIFNSDIYTLSYIKENNILLVRFSDCYQIIDMDILIIHLV